MATTILRLPAVKARTGLSRSAIYLRVAGGAFPRPVNLGSRAVGWVEADIEAWLVRHIAASRGTTGLESPLASSLAPQGVPRKAG